MERPTIEALSKWVRAGGVIVSQGLSGVETVEGDRSPWEDLIRLPGGRVIEVSRREGVVDALRRAGVSALMDRPVANVTATRFGNRMLYLNSGDEAAEVNGLHLEPHSIGETRLD